MQILWNKRIIPSNPWEPECEGSFFKVRDKVHFCFKDASAVAVLAEDMFIPQRIYPESEEGTIPLPGRWILLEDADTKLLFLRENLVLNLYDMNFTSTPEQAALEQYRAACRPEKYYVEASFIHGEYCIAHKGQWGYECVKNGDSIWEFKGQGYLYTDICCWNNRVYFCTAGRGGYFYILDMETGDAVFSIKTGGTASMIRKGPDCYILSNEKNAVLLCVDLRNGHIKESLHLPGKANVYSKLVEIDGNIHATTFEYKRSEMQSAVWTCIKI